MNIGGLFCEGYVLGLAAFILVLIERSVPKVYDVEHCSSTASVGPCYKCLARDITLSLSTSLLHSAGYPLDISQTPFLEWATVRASVYFPLLALI